MAGLLRRAHPWLCRIWAKLWRFPLSCSIAPTDGAAAHCCFSRSLGVEPQSAGLDYKIMGRFFSGLAQARSRCSGLRPGPRGSSLQNALARPAPGPALMSSTASRRGIEPRTLDSCESRLPHGSSCSAKEIRQATEDRGSGLDMMTAQLLS